MPASIKRGFRYFSIGGGTFFVDLALLFTLADLFAMDILLATGLAFIGALTLNYTLSRRYVFWESDRSYARGYAYFFIIALIGVVLTVGLMWVLVTYTTLHFIVSRVIVALFVGVWNYYLNLIYNFKLAETPLETDST